MVGLMAKMLGSPKALEQIVGAASKGLDALVYTKEEKAQDAAKQRAALREQVVSYMEATQGQTLTRRVLALGIFFIWGSFMLTALALHIAAVWINGELSVKMRESSELINDQLVEVDGLLMIVLPFYFMAPHVRGLIEPVVKKFTGKMDRPSRRVERVVHPTHELPPGVKPSDIPPVKPATAPAEVLPQITHDPPTHVAPAKISEDSAVKHAPAGNTTQDNRFRENPAATLLAG